MSGPPGAGGARRTQSRLPPEVNRIVYVKNLPFKITSEEMYDIFGRFGPIRQIRMGNTSETRGRAFVVYDDIYDAKQAVEHLSGFNVRDRYITVVYHRPEKDPAAAKPDLAKRREDLEAAKAKYGVTEEDLPQTTQKRKI